MGLRTLDTHPDTHQDSHPASHLNDWTLGAQFIGIHFRLTLMVSNWVTVLVSISRGQTPRKAFADGHSAIRGWVWWVCFEILIKISRFPLKPIFKKYSTSFGKYSMRIFQNSWSIAWILSRIQRKVMEYCRLRAESFLLKQVFLRICRLFRKKFVLLWQKSET